MRVCPACGYHEDPLWENCRFRRDLMIMRNEDFEKLNPELFKQLKKESFVRVEGKFCTTVYHKTKLYVLKKELHSPDEPWHFEFEAHKNKRDFLSEFGHRRQHELKTQRRLLESAEQ